MARLKVGPNKKESPDYFGSNLQNDKVFVGESFSQRVIAWPNEDDSQIYLDRLTFTLLSTEVPEMGPSGAIELNRRHKYRTDQ